MTFSDSSRPPVSLEDAATLVAAVAHVLRLGLGAASPISSRRPTPTGQATALVRERAR
ncbi:hypothetical protein ACFP2T_35290 [Plantactinospora solaniradicis]|uniref:Uncharacterized protein n=1 Tax=Plantactinospora solaniradicis TaxID=1723736 RepID=A0ABW1KJJ9_9ACTN